MGNDDENDKTDEILVIQETKLNDGSATDEPFLLASQKSEENQGWYQGNDDKNNEINKTLCLTSLVLYAFIIKIFYHCNEITMACV